MRSDSDRVRTGVSDARFHVEHGRSIRTARRSSSDHARTRAGAVAFHVERRWPIRSFVHSSSNRVRASTARVPRGTRAASLSPSVHPPRTASGRPCAVSGAGAHSRTGEDSSLPVQTTTASTRAASRSTWNTATCIECFMRIASSRHHAHPHDMGSRHRATGFSTCVVLSGPASRWAGSCGSTSLAERDALQRVLHAHRRQLPANPGRVTSRSTWNVVSVTWCFAPTGSDRRGADRCGEASHVERELRDEALRRRWFEPPLN